MTRYRLEIWCDGDCGARLLETATHDDPVDLPGFLPLLLKRARQAGWTQQDAAIWCPRCVRSVRPELAKPEASVLEGRQQWKLGGR
jgi:hypothetical protein